MAKNWMAELDRHYDRIRTLYPDEKLLILFDIDGTILDMRHMVWRLLKGYDFQHQTDFFADLDWAEINVSENEIGPLLADLGLPSEAQQQIVTWYDAQAWSSAAILEAHRPFSGVLEVIRWFQLRPNSFVGLNTARPNSLRAETLNSLNKLGQEYKVNFTDELLYMRPDDWTASTPQAKAAGVRYFQQVGYRLFAFVDNEPANLQGVSENDSAQEILLLHADTIFESKRTQLPARSVGGSVYDLTELIPRRALPQHINFVWSGLNDRANLARFLATDVHWGELSLWLDSLSEEFISLFGFFAEASFQKLEFNETLARLRIREKGAKLNLKAGHRLIDRVLELVELCDYQSENLWFSGSVEILQEQGIRQIVTAHPEAIIEIPVDFLAPLICTAPDKSKEILEMFRSWGVNRFAISWETPSLRRFFDQMDQWGYEINIYDVPDLEAFLRAVLLMPRAITSNFNFPKWHYYGQGSHDNGRQRENSSRQVTLKS
jgi:hypothetical protein